MKTIAPFTLLERQIISHHLKDVHVPERFGTQDYRAAYARLAGRNVLSALGRRQYRVISSDIDLELNGHLFPLYLIPAAVLAKEGELRHDALRDKTADWLVEYGKAMPGAGAKYKASALILYSQKRGSITRTQSRSCFNFCYLGSGDGTE